MWHMSIVWHMSLLSTTKEEERGQEGAYYKLSKVVIKL